MKTADKGILLGIAVAVVALVFYLMVLAPKRNEAADLADQVNGLEDQIAAQEQVVAYAEQARREYPRFYGRLVVLGKAVPEQADSASLLVQLNSEAGDANVQFRGITLGTGGETTSEAGATVAAATPGTAGTTATTSDAAASSSGSTAPATDSGAAAGSTATTTTTTATPAPATEASAATLPIGATVGPAGLPTLPYELDFKGGFFGIADYIGGLDSFVTLRDGTATVDADGRLITIDGFALSGGGPEANPSLAAKFAITTYVTPQQQGLTGGASPTTPAPAQPDVSTASATP